MNYISFGIYSTNPHTVNLLELARKSASKLLLNSQADEKSTPYFE